MELSSKLLRSASLLILLTGCYASDTKPKSPKNQLVIVLDKSQSVSYENKIANVFLNLKAAFKNTYTNCYEGIQFSKFEINGDTRVFPAPIRFELKCPTINPESRSEQLALQSWQLNRDKWLNVQATNIANQIKETPNSKTTDVFSIFEGLQQVQKSDGPWDRINVLIFSDLINTTSVLNMNSIVNNSNPHQLGKNICASLVQTGRIRKGNLQNIYITIYPPDRMQHTLQYNSFWKGFFQEWGIPDNQYRFED
jgi:hypothetical protein